jgi:peptide/nickel transport system substrate-binding protein
MPQPVRTAQAMKAMLAAARTGALPRREFVARLGALGVSAPVAAMLLLDAGLAQAAPAPYKPTKRGGGGTLKLLFWQGPTQLNPHFATGDKDLEAGRPFYEPLVRIDPAGNLIPMLAAELPSKANGGVAADGKSVLWKLKPGVKWHDGQPFTADDVVFNWRYATHPETAAVTIGYYEGTSFEKVDALTVRVRFDKPTPYWPGVYSLAQLIPQHLFKDYIGAKSREAPNNLKPVGTGPYKFVEFKPGDLLRASINTNYHNSLQPHFDALELKGGGDAVSAARAVLQTAEFDYAWFLLVEDEVLKRLEAGGKGRVVYSPGNAVESLMLNFSDPNAVVDGERGHIKSRHPVLGDAAVREALKLLIDREGVQKFIYGRAARATANYLNAPDEFRSSRFKPEFNIEKANSLLEAAGWKRGADGIREKAGKRLSLLYQTSINAPRQKIQQIVKQAAQKAGIDIQLKTVVGSTFFSSDVGNPDTAGKFWADLQMYERSGSLDPARLMEAFTSWNASQKANKWSGLNVTRWRSADYDAAYKAAATELDPARRAAHFIRMNDLVCEAGCVIPVVHRFEVGAQANKLVGELSGWDNQLASIASWYRDN